jgi:uncharacterized protein HemX
MAAKASPMPAKASPAGAKAGPAAAPPPASVAGPVRPPAERTQEIRDDELVAVRPRASWEHSTLPATGAPLPSLAGNLAHPPPTPPAAPTATVAAPEPTHRGVWLIVAAVLVAVAILGSAFWYRARQEQLRREQEIEERLRAIQRG